MRCDALACVVKLATWKVELVEKMERDAKMSQDRLMESRVAYEREKGVLEVRVRVRVRVRARVCLAWKKMRYRYRYIDCFVVPPACC